MPDSNVIKSDIRLSLLNVFNLMVDAGGVESKLLIDSDGAFSYNGLRYEMKGVQKELAELNKADLLGFHGVRSSGGGVPPQQSQPSIRRRSQDCLSCGCLR